MVRKSVKRLWGKVNGVNAIDALRDEVHDARAVIDSTRQDTSRLAEQVIGLSDDNARLSGKADTSIRIAEALNMQITGRSLEGIYKRDKSKPSIFVLSTHDYGNIGDLAITYSETVFLEKNFSEHQIFVISRVTLISSWQRIVNSISESDILVLHGGGNMGDIWAREEYLRRRIVSTFKKNVIVSFPQSIKFFDEKELERSADTYNAHPRLLIALRDDASFEIASKHFNKAKLVRTEDVVMGYEYPAPDREDWGGVLFVMRNDREKRQDSGIERLYEAVSKVLPVGVTDTVVPDMELFSVEYGANLVYRKIDELRAAGLVVTDRLHGAIFALIAGRPVVVFDNNYGKIEGALKVINDRLEGRILFATSDGSNVTIDKIQTMHKLDTSNVRPSDALAKEIASFASTIRDFIR